MKNDKTKFMLCALFFVVLAAITFRCAWPADYVFSASDLNIGRLAFIKSHLPQSFVGYFTANQLLGSTGAGYSFFNVLLTLFPLTGFANAFYGLVLVAGSLSLVWFLRMWNRSWAAAVVGALVAFWVNSVMLASGGHAYKMEVLALSVLGVGLIEKAVRAKRTGKVVGFSVLAGLSVGIMMIEQQDVALLAGLFVGSYTLFRLIQVHGRAILRWMAVLVPVGVVALLLSGSTMLKSYEQNIAKATSVQGETEDKWDFITQWSMVPEEWPDLIASGWSGWGSNNPDGPYWGKIGQSAGWESTKKGFRNFKITSIYFGIVPFLLGAFGLAVAVRKRKTAEGKVMLFWGLAGLVGLWLAFGKYSILYRGFFELPLVGNIRAPMKFLDNFQICLGIAAAYGLDALASDGSRRKWTKIFWIACFSIAGLLLLAGLKHLVSPTGQIEVFTHMGFGQYAKVMVRNMSNAWFHAALLALVCGGLGFVVWKGFKPARWAAFAFIVVLAADSLALTSHYFQASDIKALKNGNMVVNYIKKNQGDERTFFADPGGIYNQWLASDGPYHGLNLFNVWQMSRMPGDYKEFLGTVGRNQIRLWELSAIKYVAAPAGILQQLKNNPEIDELFQPVLNYKVPTDQGMRDDVLLEFRGRIPRFSLFQGWESISLEEQCKTLASPAHSARTTLLLDPASKLGSQPGTMDLQPLEAKVTKRSATLSVRNDALAIVRFSQYFQPGWKVFVDGKPAKLLRVDYLCMGVAVPSGEHVVEFRCDSGAAKAYFALGILIGSIALAVWLLRPARKADA